MYRFQRWPELVWFVATAVFVVILQQLAAFDPAQAVDWRQWAVALAAASMRAAAGAALAWIGGGAITAGKPDSAKGRQ